jgi:hypothetical protein
MKQIICKCTHNANYAFTTGYIGLNDGEGSFSIAVTFGINKVKHPWSVSGTFRNLTVYTPFTHPDISVMLMVNGVATALSVSLLGSDTIKSNISDDIAINAGDDVVLRLTSAAPVLYPGYSLGFSIEFEGNQAVYGICPFTGGGTAGVAHFGGAFGNGVFQTFGGSNNSNTYSICAAAGNITRLDLKTYSGAPGASSWVGYIRKNSILQDGSGGTVNTTCTITGGATSANSSFTLPVVEGDHLDIYVIRNGLDVGFANAHVAASVAFNPTVAGQFMMCGGSNDAISGIDIGWKWTRSEQLANLESKALAPIGDNGFNALGLYVEVSGAPGPGRSFTYTLRRSGVDTLITVTVQDLDTSGSIIATVPFISGQYTTIQITPNNSPIGGLGFHWGLALDTSVAPPPPDNPLCGIYKIVPYSGKTNDTLYSSLSPITTINVKIP